MARHLIQIEDVVTATSVHRHTGTVSACTLTYVCICLSAELFCFESSNKAVSYLSNFTHEICRVFLIYLRYILRYVTQIFPFRSTILDRMRTTRTAHDVSRVE